MLRTELSVQELALESAELLPDRDTMQVIVGSFAVNLAAVGKTAASGDVTDVTITVPTP